MINCLLFQHLKKRNRVRMIEYFVDVAKECTNIGNFNSLMAIIGVYKLWCIAYVIFDVVRQISNIFV